MDDSFGLRLRQNYVSVSLEGEKPQILYMGYSSREVTGFYIHMENTFPLALIHSSLAKVLERSPESFYASKKN